MRPHEGITAVTLEHAIAAPFATRQLADLGARVIKVERREVGASVGSLPALLPPGSWEEGEPRMDPVAGAGRALGRDPYAFGLFGQPSGRVQERRCDLSAGESP